MKIAVVSDTHLKFDLPDELKQKLGEADVVIHAGDFITKEAYEAFRAVSKRLIAVYGNSDDPAVKEMLPESVTVELGGVKFGVVHKGKNVTDTTHMRYEALEMGVEVLIFGHLHRPLIEKSDVLLVCPGSPTSPRMSDPAMVMLDVTEGKVSGSVVMLKGASPCDYIKFMRSLENQ